MAGNCPLTSAVRSISSIIVAIFLYFPTTEKPSMTRASYVVLPIRGKLDNWVENWN